MGEEESSIGMPLTEAKRRLEGFSMKRIQIINAIDQLNVDPLGDSISPEYLRLKGQLASLDKSIEETREWYLVRVLESLDETSQRLKVSAEKQVDATKALHQSSRTLEILTIFLITLTALTAGYGFFGPDSPYRFYYSSLFVVLIGIIVAWLVFWRHNLSSKVPTFDSAMKMEENSTIYPSTVNTEKSENE